MLLDPGTWALAHRIDEVLPRLPEEVQPQVCAETHDSAVEVQTGICSDVASAVDEIRELRCWDVVRVDPATVRAFEAGDDGLELIAIGSDRPDGGDGVFVDPAWID